MAEKVTMLKVRRDGNNENYAGALQGRYVVNRQVPSQ